jgi:hypothetical protein
MKKVLQWRTVIALAAVLVIFGAGALVGAVSTPSSVIHVVTIKWADGASQADIDKALAGVKTLGEKYDGITRVWTRSFKAQGMDAAFVMEFESEQALKDYAGSDAQKEWYESYLPVRGQSRTFDITN